MYAETTLLVKTQNSTRGACSLARQQKAPSKLAMCVSDPAKTQTKLMSAERKKTHARLMSD